MHSPFPFPSSYVSSRCDHSHVNPKVKRTFPPRNLVLILLTIMLATEDDREGCFDFFLLTFMHNLVIAVESLAHVIFSWCPPRKVKQS